MRTSNDLPKWDSFGTIPRALTEDIVVLKNSGVIPRYYSHAREEVAILRCRQQAPPRRKKTFESAPEFDLLRDQLKRATANRCRPSGL